MINLTKTSNYIEDTKQLLDKLYSTILDEYSNRTDELLIMCKIEKNITELRNELI